MRNNPTPEAPKRNASVAQRRRRSAFTIIELLIAVIIIGILVAIIVPVLANRASDARLAAVRVDLDAISTAETHAAIDTGHFYRLFALDDIKGTGDNKGSSDVTDGIDALIDEPFRNDVTPGTESNIFIDTDTGQIQNGAVIFNLAKNETAFNWNGPYVNYARKSGPAAPWLQIQNYPAGLPIDPYGQPYMFFTKAGLVRDRNNNGGNTGSGFVVVTDDFGLGFGAYNCKIFDRPTIVSFGPNAVPGDGSGVSNTNGGQIGQGDDIFRQF